VQICFVCTLTHRAFDPFARPHSDIRVTRRLGFLFEN
jgi:hypothetical protein